MAADTQPVSADRLELRYRGGTVIPEHAALFNGQPFTGHALGTVGTADWIGYFKDGRPHGKFSVTWNDLARYALWFDHGVFVEDARAKGNGSGGGV